MQIDETQSWLHLKTLTAVSSAFLSFSSTFPPGKAVSPAYARKVDARLKSCYRTGESDPVANAPAEQNVQIALPPYEQRHKYGRAPLARVLDILPSRCVVCESANTPVREMS